MTYKIKVQYISPTRGAQPAVLFDTAHNKEDAKLLVWAAKKEYQENYRVICKKE